MNYLNPIPKSLGIEITTKCNARCIICPRLYTRRSINTDMEVDICINAVKQAIELGIKTVTIQNLGEPTLHADYLNLVPLIKAECSFKNVSFYHYTNGSTLKNPKIRKAILDNLDEVRISIDGVTGDQITRTRPGLDLSEIEEGVKLLWNERKRKKPIIMIRGTILPSINRIDHKHKWKKFSDVVTQLNYVDIKNDKPVNRATRSCADVFNRIQITVTGNMIMCCRDYNDEVVYGNIHETPLKNLFYSEKAREIRRLHFEGKANKIKRCARCTAPRFLPIKDDV